jgi:regulator of protease activity HflC (stomatin/prohibitin superfamily)
MALFILGLICLGAAVVLFLSPDLTRSRALSRFLGVVAVIVAVTFILMSTAMYVADDKGGLVIRKLGPDLPANRVVAANGEKGPQAEILGPGWHFGLWPWNFDLAEVDTITIDRGEIGLISALDGKPLPAGEVFAPAWPSAEDMLDGVKFLTGDGIRGPQLTVLTPGRYRYNPRLFHIETKPVTSVAAGEVAVVKANAGPVWIPPAGDKVEDINGTPLVAKGFRGVWREPLGPGAYNLHPNAFQAIKVATTQRVYTYQNKHWAIRVRSKDGFTFPVDVRVSAIVSAADAPYLVAELADPDKVVKDDQEDETLSLIEAKVILPLIRTHLRNVAEGMNALQFVNSRSQVQDVTSAKMREELKRYRIATDGVFIGNIELDETEAGKALLATQTDREVAVNQQTMFGEKKKAEESRATFILAQEQAEQQRTLAAATYQVQVREQQAKAREVEARGEARYIEITAEARKKAYEGMASAIGAQGVTQLEMLKAVAEGKVQITPQVMVVGGGSGGAMDALVGTILGRAATEAAPKKER